MGGNPFWIHDPTTVTVCDEFVYALLVTLDRQAAVVTSIWSDLAPRDNPGASPSRDSQRPRNRPGAGLHSTAGE